jgi:hypothetical protein
VEFSVPLPDYSLTGSYTAMLTIGEDTEIGRTDFSVEDFIPDRMKVKVATEADGYRAGDTIDIKVEALTLFGPPAAGRHVKAGVEVVDYEFTPSGWEGFTFSNPRLSFESESFDLGEADLDDEGRHVFRFGVPTTLKPPAALRGIISATVLEPGGRAVTDHREVDIHPYSRYVGIRRTASGYAEINQLAELDYVLTTPEGRAIEDQQLKVSFYRIVWQSILRNTGRRGYRYVSERVEELQQEFTVRSESGGASFDVTPTDYGRYLVVVEDPATSASAAIYFYVSGWGYAPWAMDEPDRVELGLDRETYRAGEQATLQIRAPFSGKLLLTVERDEVYEHRVLVLEENTATLTLPVRQEYKPNVYISAHLIQSTEDLEPNTPVRAFGVVPLKVNTEDHLLRVSLDTPEVIRPNRELTVDFQVEGLAGRPADITIAAVDEGILQLTDFGTPDPHGHFLGKRRLDVKSHDLYGMVLPEFESESSSSPGGTEMAAPRRLSPVAIQRVKPVAFWSGLVRTDADGRGEVRFRIPQFAGTVRLMAAAAVRDRFGNGESKVVVREPLQMTPTLPRFLAGRDEFRVPVAVYNGMGRAAEVTVGLAVDGPVEVVGEGRHTLTITADAEEVVYFDARAGDGMGKITFTLTAEAGGERSEIKTDVPLRPPVPVVTLAGSGVASDGEPGQFTFPGGWVEGTAKFGVTSTAFPTVRFSAGLQYLFRYPHGCVEQTVSRLFPMLYFRELARLVEPELFRNNSAEYFIAEGLTKLEAMQLGNGAFSYWPRGNYTNDWSTLYATHFLIEARRAGYEVSDRVYNKAVALLSGFARSYTGDKQHNLQVAAYSCYLASLAGKPERSSMNYLKDSAADEMRESSLYQLAGAFGLAGDMVTARSLLPKAAAPPAVSAEREDGGNFNSPVRAQAVCLDVLAEIAPQHPMVPPLVEALTEAAGEDRRWRNTQENAFALMALGKILRGEEGGSFTGRLEVAGREIGSFDTRGAEFSGTGWDGDSALVRITGEGRCFYYWRADGLPADRRIEESDRDLEVRRRFLSEEGEPLDYADIGQGDLVVAEVTARTTAGSLENVAIVDLLPAGLEIENPRLESRRTLPWVKKAGSRPLYLDFRDDRIVFYDNLRQGKEYVYYYSLRAVTAGRFILPPIRAEAMYAPMKSSVASSGNITVRTAR